MSTETENKTDFSELKEEIDRYKAISGSLRYSFGKSDSLLLKTYSVFFLFASGFVTILFILGMISNMGKVANTPPVGRVWGFFPFFTLVYLVVEALLLLPIYIPMRMHRKKLKGQLEKGRSEEKTT